MKFRITTRQIAFSGILAAVYAAVTLSTAWFAYGPIQFRIAEALSVLCCFEPTAVIGMTLGCFIANIFSPVGPLDMAVGTLATLIAVLCMVRWRKPWQMIWPNVISNGVLVGALLASVGFALTDPVSLTVFSYLGITPVSDSFWFLFVWNGLEVAFGELVVMVVLGLPLWYYLDRTQVLKKLNFQ